MNGLHVNHAYLLAYIQARARPGGRYLDYGCGAAELVAAGRAAGLDFYGAEVFYEGGDTRAQVQARGLLGEAVRELDGDKLPFPDGFFDLVVSNQVFEHVERLDTVLAEIARVLKPGGVVLSLFPAREVWREGHCGIPFLHRFRKGSTVRLYYAWLLRSLGCGYHTQGKSRYRWAADFCDWLDNYTHYRPMAELNRLFAQAFACNTFIEYDYVLYRLARSGRLARLSSFLTTPGWRSLLNGLFRRAGGLVIYSQKA